MKELWGSISNMNERSHRRTMDLIDMIHSRSMTLLFYIVCLLLIGFMFGVATARKLNDLTDRVTALEIVVAK